MSQRPVKRSFTGTVEFQPARGKGPPPPLDPRMERAVDTTENVAWTFVVVPRGGQGQVRDYTLTTAQLKVARYAILATAVLVIALVYVLGVTIPRSLAYGGLLEENLALKMHIQQIDEKMVDVDRLLLRLRLYDAQIKGLSAPQGDHGGLDVDDFANAGFHDPEGTAASAAGALEELELDASVGYDDAGEFDGLRPAEAWAQNVIGRADNFIELFQIAEPELNLRVGQMEDLKAIEDALPQAWPTKGLLTSGYGWRRNPFSRSRWKFHSGLDVANRPGTPIVAAGRGTVVRAYYNSGYGRMVEIDHGYGITTLYAHCTRLYVEKGDVVEAGDPIGTIGTTGRSTGPHLHFEVRLDGNPVDPLDYLPADRWKYGVRDGK